MHTHRLIRIAIIVAFWAGSFYSPTHGIAALFGFACGLYATDYYDKS